MSPAPLHLEPPPPAWDPRGPWGRGGPSPTWPDEAPYPPGTAPQVITPEVVPPNEIQAGQIPSAAPAAVASSID